MILFIVLSSFLFLFFLALSTSNIIRAQQDELAAKIEDRLATGDKTITTFHIERKERMSDLPFLDRMFRSMESMKKLQDVIKQAGLSISLGSFLMGSLLFGVLAFFAVFLMTANALVSSAAGMGLLILPFMYVGMRRSGRTKRFSDRFPDAIGVMASSLRAGHSLQIAFETVVQETGDIISEEFKCILSEFEVGQNFEEALKGVLSRVDTPELRLFISAVVLQRETGGNLAVLLDNLELMIRDRQELKRELASVSGQAKLSGIILSLLPVAVALIIFNLTPQHVLFFFKDPLGSKILTMTAGWYLIGIFIMRKMVHIEM